MKLEDIDLEYEPYIKYWGNGEFQIDGSLSIDDMRKLISLYESYLKDK